MLLESVVYIGSVVAFLLLRPVAGMSSRRHLQENLGVLAAPHLSAEELVRCR